jgi:LPXTG-motif cell wall-anchored protein
MGILPGNTNNWYLIGGLAMIGVGFAMTLNYR